MISTLYLSQSKAKPLKWPTVVQQVSWLNPLCYSFRSLGHSPIVICFLVLVQWHWWSPSEHPSHCTRSKHLPHGSWSWPRWWFCSRSKWNADSHSLVLNRIIKSIFIDKFFQKTFKNSKIHKTLCLPLLTGSLSSLFFKNLKFIRAHLCLIKSTEMPISMHLDNCRPHQALILPRAAWSECLLLHLEWNEHSCTL